MTEAVNAFEPQDSKGRGVRPALFASSLFLSDYSLYLNRILIGLADESITVALVCPDESEVRSVISPAIEIIRHPAMKLPFLGRLNKNILIEKLKKFRPTVIHCLCESQAALAAQVSKQLNLPYLLSINGLSKQTGQLLISLNRLFNIIAPSESIAAGIGRNIPSLADRVKLIKMGTFVPSSAASFSRGGRTASIAAACSMREKTDFGQLLSALKRLAIEGYEFMTIFIGNPASSSDEKGLRSLISALGLSNIAGIIPRTEPWRDVLSACDIFIEPHKSNFFNPILLEAMSVGTSVAGYKGVDDLIIENQTAVILDDSDERNIYNSLRRLLDNPEFARDIAVRAQDFVRKNHTVSEMVCDTIECYRNAQTWNNRR